MMWSHGLHIVSTLLKYILKLCIVGLHLRGCRHFYHSSCAVETWSNNIICGRSSLVDDEQPVCDIC